jgi:hypothetical protein
MTIFLSLLLLIVVAVLGKTTYTYLHQEQEKVIKPKDKYEEAWNEFVDDKKFSMLTRIIGVTEIALITLSISWILLLCYFLSDGVPSILDLFFYNFGLILLAITFSVLPFLYLERKGFRVKSLFALFHRPIIYVVLLSFLCGYLLNFYSVPFEIRFRLSQQALENFAMHPVLNNNYSKVRWVGLFPLREFDRVGTAVGVIVSKCYIIDDCGFMYSPDGEPQKDIRDNYLRIPFAKSWYYWHRKFID